MLVRAAFLSLPVGLAVVYGHYVQGLLIGTLGMAILTAVAVRLLSASAPESKSKTGVAENGAAAPVAGATLLGSFVPPTGTLDLCNGDVHVFTNELCTNKCYVMHRPTHDPARDKAGEYMHASHFSGRKRLWEIRWQLEVKVQPRGLLFALELPEYIPTMSWVRRLQTTTVSMLRGIVGKDLYHSFGEDPKSTPGEAERPVFAMPLWAFDQLVVSEPGEEPDIKDLDGHGVLRTSNRRQFIRDLSKLELRPGKVYTFAFWCISRFLDVISWQMLGVMPGGVNFNTMCGRPPVNIVMYELDSDPDNPKDERHLQSRKRYYFNLALWSSLKPPADRHLQAFAIEDKPSEEEPKEGKRGERGWCCYR